MNAFGVPESFYYEGEADAQAEKVFVGPPKPPMTKERLAELNAEVLAWAGNWTNRTQSVAWHAQ